MPKIIDVLKEGLLLLEAPNPELEGELLLSYLLKKDRAYILSNLDLEISEIISKKFFKLIKKRSNNWSLAALTGHKEFYGLDFLVNKNVLIPRPETEFMVEGVLVELQTIKNPVSVIDIGTGSGSIIVSLAKNIFQNNRFFYAGDKSQKALNIAKKNAKKHKLNIKFKKSDLFQEFFNLNSEFIIITANLPYLKPAEMTEKSIKKEPRRALLSGVDGLWHYQRLFKQISSHIEQKSIKYLSIWCEINPEQAEKIENMAKDTFKNYSSKLVSDYSQNIRFFVLTINIQ